MKKDIHPKDYRQVIFLDNASKESFLIYSTVATKETGKWKDGKEYPLVRVEVSSASHPAYTGQDLMVDTAGRVQKFKLRQAKASHERVPAKSVKKAAKALRRRSAKASAEKQSR